MVTRKAAETTLDPSVFTLDSIMGRMKPPKPETVSVFLAAELAPRLQELARRLDAAEDPAVERGIDDGDPADVLLAEYNELAAEWNASEVKFLLRAVKRSDRANARAAMVADGLDLDDEESVEISTCYVLAEVCENSEMTGGEHLKFREAIGEVAYLPLVEAMAKANMGAGVNAPFSLRHSKTPDSI